MPNWNERYNNLLSSSTFYLWSFSNENSFKKPVAWNLSIIEWWTTPEIWKNQKYKVWLVELPSVLSFSDWKLNIADNTIIDTTSWHFWNTFNLINNDFNDNISTYLGFSWSIDADSNILNWVKLKTNNLYLSYKLWTKLVKYYLDDFWLDWCNVETLWLKVIWTLQWDWKSDLTWQGSNFSDLSKSELRSKIRSNWYILIKWLRKNIVVNWIKYVEWDVSISWDIIWYETLIVKNWNVFITWDLNTSWKKFWIIVLKDNFNTKTDYNKSWNVYVNKNVEKINAIIYADWWFISAKSNKSLYSDVELNKLLTLNWTLFTRNTIWWAVKWNSNYTLPWWQITTNFDLAKLYDLNYTRMVDNNCSSWDNYSFLIKYDSKIQQDPPKWFWE